MDSDQTVIQFWKPDHKKIDMNKLAKAIGKGKLRVYITSPDVMPYMKCSIQKFFEVFSFESNVGYNLDEIKHKMQVLKALYEDSIILGNFSEALCCTIIRELIYAGPSPLPEILVSVEWVVEAQNDFGAIFYARGLYEDAISYYGALKRMFGAVHKEQKIGNTSYRETCIRHDACAEKVKFLAPDYWKRMPHNHKLFIFSNEPEPTVAYSKYIQRLVKLEEKVTAHWLELQKLEYPSSYTSLNPITETTAGETRSTNDPSYIEHFVVDGNTQNNSVDLFSTKTSQISNNNYLQLVKQQLPKTSPKHKIGKPEKLIKKIDKYTKNENHKRITNDRPNNASRVRNLSLECQDDSLPNCTSDRLPGNKFRHLDKNIKQKQTNRGFEMNLDSVFIETTKREQIKLDEGHCDITEICDNIREIFSISWACEDCTVTLNLKGCQKTNVRDHKIITTASRNTTGNHQKLKLNSDNDSYCPQNVLLAKTWNQTNSRWFSKIRDLTKILEQTRGTVENRHFSICSTVVKGKNCDNDESCLWAHNKEEQRIWNMIAPFIRDQPEIKFFNVLKGTSFADGNQTDQLSTVSSTQNIV